MDILPFSVTVPTPLLMLADAALEELQVKVALAPAATVGGEAAIVTVGATTGVATNPTHPVNPAVIKLAAMDNSRWALRSRGRFMSLYGCQKGGPKLHGSSIFRETSNLCPLFERRQGPHTPGNILQNPPREGYPGH